MIDENSFDKNQRESAELSALLKLLDDPDVEIAEAVRKKIHEYGPQVVANLRKVATEHDSPQVQENARQIIRAFQEEALENLFKKVINAFADGSDIALEETAIMLSQFGFPETNANEVSEKLDDISLRVHRHFITMQQANDLTLLMSLNRAFFEEEKFHAAETDYYAPENSYLDTLLKLKQGIPISLSVAYMLVGERAGIDLHGVGMPLHFLVFHPELNVFIDTFNHGAFLSQLDCRNFITQSGFSFSETMLARVSNMTIITRMMRNLIYAHTKQGQEWEAKKLQDTLDEIIRITDAQ
ncbi:MAG TPA: transglutaminase-like domain-containing protein [Patescibacteria group bacterium]|nr:transglutaminase-like domain-containing protein [Patescibacteria group bacterium]